MLSTSLTLALRGQLLSGVRSYQNLAFAFSRDLYQVDGRITPSTDSFTHTRASNATMVDSDGLTKWAPHNLASRSTPDAGLAGVNVSNAAGGAGVLTYDTSFGEPVYKLDNSAGTGESRISVVGAIDTLTPPDFGMKVEVQGVGRATLRTGYASYGSGLMVTSNWQTLSKVKADKSSGVYNTSDTLWLTASAGSVVYFRKHHFYRSDLGGMVNNPDTGDSYVPTTTAARYLPRVGHHVWDGSAWINRGVLLEPEARTNLFKYSDLTVAALGTAAQTIGGALLVEGSFPDVNVEVVAKGYELGLPYIDVRISGTNNSGGTQFVDIGDVSDKPTTPGTYDTLSMYMKLVAGSAGANEVQLYKHYRDASNVLITPIATDFRSQLTSTLTRFSMTTVAPALSVKLLNTAFALRLLNGASVDMTIRLAAPQMEFNSTPSSYIPTAGATATRAAETFTIAAANLPWNASAVSIHMKGMMTYADTGTTEEVAFYKWGTTFSDAIYGYMGTQTTAVGQFKFSQWVATVSSITESVGDAVSPGINVPFNVASRHGATFINGAVSGTALTLNLTPTSLPDLSAIPLTLAYLGGGMIIESFEMWGEDIGEAGIVGVTS